MGHQEALDFINKMAAELGLFPTRRRSSLIWWRVPKDWQGTKYAFGYTPWKTQDGDEVGFFAVKYRILKNGDMKLVKSVRFGRRKVARERSLLWHHKHYQDQA